MPYALFWECSRLVWLLNFKASDDRTFPLYCLHLDREVIHFLRDLFNPSVFLYLFCNSFKMSPSQKPFCNGQPVSQWHYLEWQTNSSASLHHRSQFLPFLSIRNSFLLNQSSDFMAKHTFCYPALALQLTVNFMQISTYLAHTISWTSHSQ